MIRVNKTPQIPLSLLAENCNRHNSEDVKELLLKDQHQKCYLCEQLTGKSFQIDHLRAQAANRYPELKFTWTNLFLICPFCNQRKSESFEILEPTLHNIRFYID